MSFPTSYIASSAAQAAAQKVTQEVLGKCRQDKQGNIYTVGSDLFRGMIKILNIIIGICCVGIVILYLIPSEEDFKDPAVFLILGIVLVVIVLLNLLYKYRLKCKFTLLPEGLAVEYASLSAVIPYSEVREWIQKYPPVEYRFFYCMILRDTLIRYNFSYMVGSLGFLAALFQQSDLPLPDIARMEQKVQAAGVAHVTAADKAAYQQLKECAKQLKNR